MFKEIFFILCVCGSAVGVFAKDNKFIYSNSSSKSTADHAIKAHTNDGKPHASAHATNPNNTKADNYSTKGNVNPYTGKVGTK